MRFDLAIPERPVGQLLPPDWERIVAAQLAATNDFDPLLEGRRRAAALQKYVNAKADKEAVKRIWLLTAKRIGELLGPAVGASGERGWESSPASDLITKDDRYRFRLLAQHWDDIADVMISAGTPVGWLTYPQN